MIFNLKDMKHPSGLPLGIVQSQETRKWVTPGGYHHASRKAAVEAMEKLAVKAGYRKNQ